MENFTKTEQAKLDMLTGGSKKANYIGGIIFAIIQVFIPELLIISSIETFTE